MNEGPDAGEGGATLGAAASLLIWACMVLVTGLLPLLMFPAFLFGLPFDRTAAWTHWVAGRWARAIVGLVPGWRVTVEGSERLRRGPFVIVANHQSQVDILVMYFLGHHFKWLSKRAVFRIPLLGWMMHMCRYIPVVRHDRRSALRALAKSAEWIRRGVSVMFFPEGTRSPSGSLQPFKTGAFRVAADTGAPVLPVLVLGTRSCLPKNSWRFGRRGDFRVVVGEPIPSAGVAAEGVAEFTGRVFHQFQTFRGAVETQATAAS